MPLPTQTLSNNFAQWSVRYSMYTGLSGQLSLTNQENQYTVANTLWVPVALTLNTTVDSDLVDDSQLSGNTTWFNGLISSFNDSSEISEEMVSVGLTSYFVTVSRKPINSQYYNAGAATVLTDVLGVYAGIPAALLSFTMGSNATVFGIVQGNDLMVEAKKIAAAGASDLFVQVGGVLTADAWVDETSPVDFVFPDEAIISAKLNRSRTQGPTRLYIRGRWTGQAGCGQKLINNGSTVDPSKIKKDHCYKNGIRETSSTLHIKGLAGTAKDISNSGFELSGDQTFGEVVKVPKTGGEALLRTTPSSGNEIAPLTLNTTEMMVHGRNDGSEEKEDVGSKSKGSSTALTQHDLVLSALTDSPPGTFRGGDSDASRTGDAPNKNRLEVAVQDTDLAAEFGVVTEDVDNPYLSYGFNAFWYGIRRFKQFKMQRNTYNVVVAYMPGVRLNHVVTFTHPDTATTITGRVSEIGVQYTPTGSKVGMNLKVESFDELGSTVYQSGNLLTYPDLCGINGVNWVIDSGDIYAISGYFAFDGVGEIQQPIFLASGYSFDLTARVILVSGTGTLVSKHYNAAVLGGTSAVQSASGTFTYSFTPTTYDVTIAFEVTAGEWFMTTPHLSVSVTA